MNLKHLFPTLIDIGIFMYAHQKLYFQRERLYFQPGSNLTNKIKAIDTDQTIFPDKTTFSHKTYEEVHFLKASG